MSKFLKNSKSTRDHNGVAIGVGIGFFRVFF